MSTKRFWLNYYYEYFSFNCFLVYFQGFPVWFSKRMIKHSKFQTLWQLSSETNIKWSLCALQTNVQDPERFREKTTHNLTYYCKKCENTSITTLGLLEYINNVNAHLQESVHNTFMRTEEEKNKNNTRCDRRYYMQQRHLQKSKKGK